MIKLFLYIFLFSLIIGCATQQSLIENKTIAPGMTKVDICDATMWTTSTYEDPCMSDTEVKFFKEIQMETWKKNYTWYIFKDVTVPRVKMKKGNGKLYKIVKSNKEALDIIADEQEKKSTTKLTIDSAIEKYLKGRKLDPLEGIWFNEKEIATEVIVKKNNVYERYHIEHKLKWKYPSGSKYPFDLTETATPSLYVGKIEIYNTADPDEVGIGTTKIILDNINLYIEQIPKGCWTTYKCWKPIDDFAIRLWPKNFYEYNKQFGSSDDDNSFTQDHNSEKIESYGTGFYINDNGDIISNNHVVEGCSKLFYYKSKENEIPLEIISTDKSKDLAILKSYDSNNEYINLFNDDPEQASDVLVYGFPYGTAISSQVKITKGIVSATVGPGDDSSSFQLDAAVSPGNSGGPIVNKDGNLVGVVFATTDKDVFKEYFGTIPENMNFGIKVSALKTFLESYNISYSLSNKNNKVSNKSVIQIYCSN